MDACEGAPGDGVHDIFVPGRVREKDGRKQVRSSFSGAGSRGQRYYTGTCVDSEIAATLSCGRNYVRVRKTQGT